MEKGGGEQWLLSHKPLQPGRKGILTGNPASVWLSTHPREVLLMPSLPSLGWATLEPCPPQSSAGSQTEGRREPSHSCLIPPHGVRLPSQSKRALPGSPEAPRQKPPRCCEARDEGPLSGLCACWLPWPETDLETGRCWKGQSPGKAGQGRSTQGFVPLLAITEKAVDCTVVVVGLCPQRLGGHKSHRSLFPAPRACLEVPEGPVALVPGGCAPYPAPSPPWPAAPPHSGAPAASRLSAADILLLTGKQRTFSGLLVPTRRKSTDPQREEWLQLMSWLSRTSSPSPPSRGNFPAPKKTQHRAEE